MNLSIWMFNDIVIVMSKEMVFWPFRSNLSFGLRYGTLYTLASVIKSFGKIAQTVDQTSEFSSGDIRFFLEAIPLLCLYMTKRAKLDCNRFLVGASANSHYSMLWLGIVKNVVVKVTNYVNFVQNLLWHFLVKWIEFEHTVNLLFEKHQLPSVSKFCKKNLSVV